MKTISIQKNLLNKEKAGLINMFHVTDFNYFQVSEYD